MENIIRFPGSVEGPAEVSTAQAPTKVEWRDYDSVRRDIDAHVSARDRYAQAAVWAAQAESMKLPAAQIEDARSKSTEAYQELQWRGRCLLVCMPTDQKALVELLLYMEKHFSILPPEIDGKSMAFDLSRIMRLSLRKIANHGKSGPRR